jgi:hypothetical protein
VRKLGKHPLIIEFDVVMQKSQLAFSKASGGQRLNETPPACLLHVSQLGEHNTEEKLQLLLRQYGKFVSAVVRHKETNGVDKSWALVTMGDAAAAQAVLDASPIRHSIPPDGMGTLAVKPFDNDRAAASSGAMAELEDTLMGYSADGAQPQLPSTSGDKAQTSSSTTTPSKDVVHMRLVADTEEQKAAWLTVLYWLANGCVEPVSKLRADPR